MNSDQIKGKLKQLGGQMKKKWGQLTDDDLKEASGNLDILVGKIQELSGDRREEIELWFKAQGL
ncbi:MAG: CsbD family protein [Candidatus Binataceae bacterium]